MFLDIFFVFLRMKDMIQSMHYLKGPWKRKSLVEVGVQNQCFTSKRLDEKCLNQLLLKINAKVILPRDDRQYILFFLSFLSLIAYPCSLQLGGLNYNLSAEITRTIPLVSKVPTMIFGLDISHFSQPDMPSIAAVSTLFIYFLSIRQKKERTKKLYCKFPLIDNLYLLLQVVGSRKWPLISCYRASVHTQPRKVQLMDSLFQPVSEKEDKGSFR